uniref:AlNc14C133G7014 protein n=1 Tax=Albugo laibachii Nc14 TaxID=890382 RepID=F0WKG2_9STRA|nr:AlNc14C133G7014 [Albugo laibachii Nc14]|eukprot:CCA21766.1 AlNc14C133G7014 [Albugo laibachii Nc14]
MEVKVIAYHLHKLPFGYLLHKCHSPSIMGNTKLSLIRSARSVAKSDQRQLSEKSRSNQRPGPHVSRKRLSPFNGSTQLIKFWIAPQDLRALVIFSS